MTRSEAEKEAVRGHSCPYCRAQAGYKCRQKTVVKVRFLKSPHIERMKEVPQWLAELENRAQKALASTGT